MAETTPDIIVLKFADSKVPVFKEARNKDYIKYGEDNLYPEYLTYLFNKSAKHNAILTGKAYYIFGKGFENGDVKVNRLGDTLNDITRKAVLDTEIYGGFRLEVIWNKVGRIAEIYHVDYTSIRVAKETGFYYKENWQPSNRDEEIFVPAFNPAEPIGSQIYAYNEYRPMTRYYPLPAYIGANNYIETDIEISKYYLSAIRNGMAPSKMIQFFQGEPTEEKKREIEHRFKQKFAGAENAGQFILVFGQDKTKSVQIDDLSGSDLDKMFTELNKTCQQEIFSGHLVTSPMLFGIKTEGQLGGSTELNLAYSIFQNTYSKPKAETVSKEFETLLTYSAYPGKYELLPTDPIGLQFDAKDVLQNLPRTFVFKTLGIPEEEWNGPSISGGAVAAPTLDSDIPTANDNVKNLTAKQHQQVLRIIRQYSKGQLTEQAAKALLRTGLGLSEEDINNLLGIEPVAMSAQDDDAVISVFDAFGESKKDYEVLKSKKVSFASELECEADEAVYINEAFAGYDVSVSESEILGLLKKDPKITPEVIAEVVGETVAYVQKTLDSLTKKGYIESAVSLIGSDEVIERKVAEKIATPPVKSDTVNPARISIKYSYEGPEDSKNRPFCAKLLKLNRLYSRADIEKISERLGYSVFDRRGGFWNTGTVIKPHCRHRWQSNIVVKKTGKS